MLSTEESVHREETTTSSTRDIWRRALFKIKVRLALKSLKDDLLVYGTTNDLTDLNMRYKPHIDDLISRKEKHTEAFRKQTSSSYLVKLEYRCLLHPDDYFLTVWHCIVSLMLLYTGTVMPYRVAFSQDHYWDWWTALETGMDILFLADILIGFFSIYVRPDGSLDTDNRSIALRYLKSWFLLDLVASIPYTVVDYLVTSEQSQQARYNTLIRLMRVPRLYRLLRLLRVLKTLRRREGSMLLKVQDLTLVNLRTPYTGLTKLFQFLLSLWAAVHIAACIWYFTARASSFDPNTWVARYNLLDTSEFVLYLRSFYWSVTTMVTVGYGDIVPCTQLEQIFVICWMLIGAGFYTYTIGSLSTFFMSIDTLDSILAAKTETVLQIADQTGIDMHIREQLLAAVKFSTFTVGATWSQSLFEELPKALRTEVVSLMYGGLTKNFPFFAKRDTAFALFVVPRLHPFHVKEDAYVYTEGEYADAMFLITKGRLNLVFHPSEVVYKAYLKGSYIGEVELIRRIPRIDNAMAFGRTELLVLEKTGFEGMCEEFPLYAKEIKRNAEERERRNRQAMLETQELLRLKKKFGSLDHLAGHERILMPADSSGDFDPEVSYEIQQLSLSARSNLEDSRLAAALATETELLLQKAMARRRT